MRGWLLALALGSIAASGSATAQSSAPAGGAPDLAGLHDSLRVTPAQEGAWQAYVAAIAADQQADARRRTAAQMMPQLPTPRRLALMQAEMAAEQADLKRTAAAVLGLYNQLTPAQQQLFDRQTLPREAAGE